MEAIIQWMNHSASGEFFYTMLMSMVPVVELRGGIPFGVALGLDIWPAYIAAVIGNMLPVPFIIIFIRRIFQWMRVNMPRLNSLVDKLEQKAHLKGRLVTKYKYLGLIIFVAIPLPGTGAWTGTLAASFLNMGIKSTALSVSLGVILAGIIMGLASTGVFSIIGL